MPVPAMGKFRSLISCLSNRLPGLLKDQTMWVREVSPSQASNMAVASFREVSGRSVR